MSANGTIKEFVANRHGDVDGFLLSDGTEVKLPPHQGLNYEVLPKSALKSVWKVVAMRRRRAMFICMRIESSTRLRAAQLRETSHIKGGTFHHMWRSSKNFVQSDV